MTEKQIALFERDKGIEQVTENSQPWFELAKGTLNLIDWPETFTGEDIRHLVSDRIGNPHHHNTWGALIMYASRQKIIVKTGEYRKMKDRQSHARETPVYRRFQ